MANVVFPMQGGLGSIPGQGTKLHGLQLKCIYIYIYTHTHIHTYIYIYIKSHMLQPRNGTTK